MLKVYAFARGELEVQETPGADNTAQILEYHKATNLCATADEVPWCSAFANWCLQKCGLKGTGSALAISWIKWGIPTTKPEKGDIVVLNMDTSYHVGFFDSINPNGSINVLGGNQQNRVCILPFKASRLVAYRTLQSKDGEV